MPSEVILPRVDMDMTTGKIAKWFVENGAQVTKGQPLFEIETDKAAMEIEAPATGTIRDLAGASGADIPVGSVVAWIYKEGETAAEAPQLSASQPVRRETDTARMDAEDDLFDSALPPVAEDRSGANVAAKTAEASARPRATPMARRLARENGVDLSTLPGTGPRGRIQAADVERARAALAARAVATPASAPPAAAARSEAPQPTARAARGTLNIVQLRDGSGAPVVLVHGWGADANSWRPFLAGRPGGRPVLALDLPGHGASPLGPVTCFADLVDAAEATLAEAAPKPMLVVAHSLGGAVMAAVAARGTLDLRSLLLLAPAGLGPSINGAFLRGYLSATSEASLTPWMHELVADPAAISAAFVRATLRAREGTELVKTQRRIAELVFPDDTQAFSIRRDLARLAVPTRVVLGGADKILPASQASGLPGMIATHLFPNVGHMPQFEEREAVAAILDQMIRE